MRPSRTLHAASVTLAAALLFCLCGLGRLTPAGAEELSLALATAQPLYREQVAATGRVLSTRTARVGARLSGAIVSWAKGENGQPLDAGMTVREGEELFRVDPATFEKRVQQAQAAVKLTEAAAADLNAGTRKERLDADRAVLAELDARQAELEARVADRERDEKRIRRLVEEDKTMPVKRLEEVQLDLQVLSRQKQLLAANRLSAQARLAEAEAGPTVTERAVAAARVEEAKAQLASAALDLQDVVVKAPFAGVVLQRFKTLGDYVSNAPFVEVLELASLDHLEAELRLPETYYAKLAAGGVEVALRSPLLPADLALPVARVIPQIDAQQGTFAFRVRIPPEQRGRLAPGAFIEGALKLAGVQQGVLVPLAALITRDGKPVVFVAQQGKAQLRAVELGDRLTEAVVLRAGVQPGEKLLTGPLEKLQDGAALPGYLVEQLNKR